jgi:signal transduction histidine kinase
VEIELRHAGGKIVLRVRDNGRGFDPVARAHSGLGLSSMDERIRILGGRLDVQSAPGKGTQIMVETPAGDSDDKAQSSAG